jgi:predicted PurR-regulated permease PerM
MPDPNSQQDRLRTGNRESLPNSVVKEENASSTTLFQYPRFPMADERNPLAEPRQDTETGWLTRERLLALTLIVATGFAFYLCYRLVYPFLPAISWALALAVVTYPVHAWIRRQVPNNDAAAGLSLVIVAVLVVAPAIFLVQQAVLATSQGVESVATDAVKGHWQKVADRNPRLAPAIVWIEQRFDLRRESQRLVEGVRASLPGFVTGSLGVLLQLLITFFALYYFFRDRQATLGLLRSLSPLSQKETERMFARVADTIRATVFGTLLVAIIQGALGGLMFWWLGIPAPLLWGTAMALLALVPWLGPFVVWVPAAILLALEGSWGKALILTAWGGIVVALIDNLLYPMFVGDKLRLHTLPVFIAIIGGLASFGASGLILGPLILAITVALIDIWRYRTADGRKADVDAPV